MKKRVFVAVRKNKLAQLSLIPVLVFAAIYGLLLWQNRHGADAATANCYGNPGTHTAVVPSSVNPGQSFKITNITGTANTNIATVNSTTLTLVISGATPSTASESWNGGPVHGDYTSTYPDLSLTATGAVGGQINISISSIAAAVTIGPSNTTITCSVSNGQLTANSPGQSLILATINIVAPSSSSGSSGSGASGGTTKTSQSTVPQASQKTTTVAQNTNSQTSNSVQADTTSSTDQTTYSTTSAVAITVVDSKGKPIRGAKVTIDSMPSIATDSSGKVTLSNISTGQHNLSITVAGKTITQLLKVPDQANGLVLGVSVQMPATTSRSRNLRVGIAVAFVLAIATTCAILLKYRNSKKPLLAQQATSLQVKVGPVEASADINQLIQPKVIQPTESPTSPQPPDQNNANLPPAS